MMLSVIFYLLEIISLRFSLSFENFLGMWSDYKVFKKLLKGVICDCEIRDYENSNKATDEWYMLCGYKTSGGL